MVFTLPAFGYKIDSRGEKVMDYSVIEGKKHDIYYANANNFMREEREEDREAVRFELMNIFDLPLIIIFRNLANTIMAIISELSMRTSYVSIYSFMKVFMKENRLMYIGILTIFFSLFISFFFI